MKELMWMLDLEDKIKITLREDVAEDLGLDRFTTVGKLREVLDKPEEHKEMVEIEDDLNMEL